MTEDKMPGLRIQTIAGILSGILLIAMAVVGAAFGYRTPLGMGNWYFAVLIAVGALVIYAHVHAPRIAKSK